LKCLFPEDDDDEDADNLWKKNCSQFAAACPSLDDGWKKDICEEAGNGSGNGNGNGIGNGNGNNDNSAAGVSGVMSIMALTFAATLFL